MRVAYADPPYLGCCGLYDHFHPDGRCWDDLATHAVLFERLQDEFPDGWAVSTSSAALPQLLSTHRWDADYWRTPIRVGAWVKPFAIFKPNVNPAYAWEPIIWRGGRQPRARTEPTVRDWVSHEITLRRGLTGAKPEAFTLWLLNLLGARPDDEIVDLFPGTGAVGAAIDKWRRYRGSLPRGGLLEVGVTADAVDPHAAR